MYTFPRYVTRPPLLACTSKIPDGDDEVARVLCEHTGECRVTGDGGGELELIVSFGTFGTQAEQLTIPNAPPALVALVLGARKPAALHKSESSCKREPLTGARR